MNPTNDTTVIRRLTVLRTPDASYSHRITAQLVDRSPSQPPQAVPFAVSTALSAELTKTLSDFTLGDTRLDCRLNHRDKPLFNELKLAALMRHHLGWSPLAGEVMYRQSVRLPSQLLGVYHTADPAVRRLTPVVVFPSSGTLVPWQLAALVTSQLEDTIRQAGADAVDRAIDGYLVTVRDPALWEDPDFETNVLYHLLRHLKWAANEFTLVYADPATETTGH